MQHVASFSLIASFGGKADSFYGWLRTGDEVFLETLRDWMLASANVGSLTKLIPDPDKYHLFRPTF